MFLLLIRLVLAPSGSAQSKLRNSADAESRDASFTRSRQLAGSTGAEFKPWSVLAAPVHAGRLSSAGAPDCHAASLRR
jgi:hypothetical protein